jgi:FtsP/CotA-like multicopper oxidase with cupredoxin domain
MANDHGTLCRRDFLTSVGTAGCAWLGTGLRRASFGLVAAATTPPARAQTGDLLVTPHEIRSRNGVLEATLTAAPGPVRLGHTTFSGFLYNNAYLPPVLRARTGDVMRIRFQNSLPADPSNLHFHGMGVSPRGNSDNVFVHVHPGNSFDYEVNIPIRDRQGPGLFWYHPHVHGDVAKQVLGGMSGGIVIDGSEQYFPILRDLPERFLFIKHVAQGPREIISINGQLSPVVAIRPGEVQFWRIAHIGATLFIKFNLAGIPLYVIATDGHFLSRPQRLTEFFIGPGQRIDAIVIGPPAGEYPVRTIPFQNQAWRSPDPAQQIASVVASGGSPAAQATESEVLNQQVWRHPRWIDEVRAAPISRRRSLVYSRTADRQKFMINGRVMEEDRIDVTVRLGETEEWTIINTDQQYHSFHIHQTAFLVTEINGVAVRDDSMRDTFSVPPATDIGASSIKVVIPFTDPVIVGKFVYHCHAVDHEDKGMMGVIEVTA